MDPVQVEQVATSQLDAGERLLWSGAPVPGNAAAGAIPTSLFGIPFLAFSCFWIGMAWTATSRSNHVPGPFLFFPLFGVPFVLVGLGILLSPLWAYLSARTTVYAVTDKRALIVNGGFNRSVQSYSGSEIGDLVRVEGPDGRGSLMFGSIPFVTRSGFTSRSRVGFVGIPNVRQVEELIRENLVKKAA